LVTDAYKVFNGTKGSIEPISSLYFSQKALAEMGYTFDGEKLDNFEAQCFLILSNELINLENNKLKKGK